MRVRTQSGRHEQEFQNDENYMLLLVIGECCDKDGSNVTERGGANESGLEGEDKSDKHLLKFELR